ncbi:hypothetical protein Cni_G27095 [Canna indica]|uniref:Uncharacterized protein n=1 Tax=Canna indica TaxID=4628 RepID=A0AAQ3QRU3_9LILI|nr:hypothetical protein Cni_G27095 [Canna indica]
MPLTLCNTPTSPSFSSWGQWYSDVDHIQRILSEPNMNSINAATIRRDQQQRTSIIKPQLTSSSENNVQLSLIIYIHARTDKDIKDKHVNRDKHSEHKHSGSKYKEIPSQQQ